jgi:hypothetical protein
MNGNKEICGKLQLFLALTLFLDDFTYYGPNATHIVLVSSDGHEFVVSRTLLIESTTIMNMLMGPGKVAHNEPNKVHLNDVP